MQHRLDLSVAPGEPAHAAGPSNRRLASMSKRTRRSSSIIRWAAAAAAAAGIALAAAAPASAWDNDRPRITNQGIDFGTNWDGFGAPINGGELHWHTESNGNVDPHLVGNLYLNNSSGTRARMKIEYFDADHNEIGEEFGGIVDAPDNGLHTFAVDLEPFEGPTSTTSTSRPRPRARRASSTRSAKSATTSSHVPRITPCDANGRAG